MFALILTILSAVTGAVWLLDKYWLGPRRRAQLPPDAPDQPNIVIEFCVSFFPVIFAVFMLRSFVVEPFRIPSGSMKPTLHVGDFILVNKFTYGLRCPVGSCKFLEVGEPKRGDVIVFRWPGDPSTDFIKRVVGLPGDHVHYENKRLSINGTPVTLDPAGLYTDDEGPRQRLHENLMGANHDTIISMDLSEEPMPGWMLAKDRFDYDVPPGNYFMMGDNRDGSYDSRGWGPVPEANLKGRAMVIWLNWVWLSWPDLSRIGTVIH